MFKWQTHLRVMLRKSPSSQKEVRLVMGSSAHFHESVHSNSNWFSDPHSCFTPYARTATSIVGYQYSSLNKSVHESLTPEPLSPIEFVIAVHSAWATGSQQGSESLERFVLKSDIVPQGSQFFMLQCHTWFKLVLFRIIKRFDQIYICGRSFWLRVTMPSPDMLLLVAHQYLVSVINHWSRCILER